MELVRGPWTGSKPGLAEVKLRVDRQTLAKRRWRGVADDGREFGFDLERPLHHLEAIFHSDSSCYFITQIPESLLAVMIVTPAQAARVAWQIGNLHFPLAVRADSILVEDDPAVRHLLAREQISFQVTQDVFQPVGGSSGHHH